MSDKVKKKSKVPWGLIFNIIIVCFTIGLIIYFIFSEDGFIDLLNSGLKINVFWIIMALAMHFLNLGIDTTIIYLFVRETTPGMTFRKALVASMVGQFYCAITPSSTGGQPMQILYMSRMGIKGANATSVLIQKFLVWQFTLTVCSVISMVLRFPLFAEKLDFTMWMLTVLGFSAQVFMICALLLASFSKKSTTSLLTGLFRLLAKLHILKNVDEKIKKLDAQLTTFHESNKELTKNKGLVIEAYVLTFIQMMAFFLVPYCISMSFGGDFNVFDMLCAQSYVTMVSSLVPIPGASGAAEYCFSTFFSGFFDPQTMKSAILLWRTITYYGTIVIALPFAGVKKNKTVVEVIEAAQEAEENDAIPEEVSKA